MKNYLLFYTVILLTLFPVVLFAQSTSPIRCAADEFHEEQMQDPDYAARFRTIERQVREQLGGRTPSCASPIIVPVAIHFSGAITSANMTCLQDVVDDQIDALNEDFGGYNTDIATYCNHASNCPGDYAPTALAGGTCVQFCLATMDHPVGSGLSNGESAFTFGQYTFDTGAGPWEGYMNIFVSNIPPAGYDSSLLGLAPLFGGANPDGNGIFITASAFGGDAYSCISGITLNNSSSYNLGRTGTHEAGHYFGLLHTFEGCSNGDNIDDTPDQNTENGGAPTINYANCTSTAENSCGTQDFFFNYMDYVVDGSMYMFTSDQADVMNTTANSGVNNGTNPFKIAATTCATVPIGYSPTYPTGCPVGSPPVSDFTIGASAPYEFCPNINEITFLDASSNFPTSWSWTFSGAGVSPNSSTEENPTIEVNSTGTLTVTLTTSNSAGADPTPATMSYSITILSAVSCADCGNSFFDSGGAGGNYSNNEDVVWTFCTADPGDVVVVDFTAINIGSSFVEDYILVTNGTTAATGFGDDDYLVTLSSVYMPEGGGFYSSVSGNIITSTTNCMTFRFISDGSGTTAGWEADISCITAPTCDDGLQNQDEVFVDCGGATCPTCPTPEEGFTFYDAGGASNPTGSAGHTWQICATTGHQTIVDFTTIDMTPFNNGILTVYDGPANDGSFEYYISGSAVYVPAGGTGVTPFGTNMITSTNECFYFQFFNGSNTSNGWVAQVSSTAVLPLVLKQFTARPQEQAIALNWTTEQEVNVKAFTIQRRAGQVAEFTEIAHQPACGNCQHESDYQFVDYDVKAGINYTYRLQMIDVDGQYEYSDMATAKIAAEGSEWSVYPNPGKGHFTLSLSDHHQASALIITDQLGRKIYQQSISREDRYLDLDLGTIKSGVYQLLLMNRDLLSTKPLVVLP